MNYYINSFQCFLNLTNFFSIALKFIWQRKPPCLRNMHAGGASVRALGSAGGPAICRLCLLEDTEFILQLNCLRVAVFPTEHIYFLQTAFEVMDSISV